jgi:hypothetical protein
MKSLQEKKNTDYYCRDFPLLFQQIDDISQINTGKIIIHIQSNLC